jgi:phosphohistidine phosphatase SixA
VITFFIVCFSLTEQKSKNAAQPVFRAIVPSMKRLALVLAFLATSLAAAPNPVTTVILVRHAEKASQDADPSLSAAGAERAKELARVLSGVKVDAIYTTQYKRTVETAAPFATASGVTPVVRTAGKTFAADLAKHLLAEHRGQTVLVVGHSNTTIDVIKALGVTDVAGIPESQFDNLYVLTAVEGAEAKVVALRYGGVAR